MSKKEEKKLGFADLPLATKSLKLGLKFPTLQRRAFLTRNDLDEIKAGAEARERDLCDYIGEMGEVLSDVELGRKQDGVIRQEEAKVAAFVADCPEVTREELATAIFKTAIEKFPDSSVGLNHLADFGIGLHFLAEAGKNDTRRVILPLSREDGKWVATEFTTRVRSAGSVFFMLAAKAERVATMNAVVARDALAKLREGASNDFLAVLESGGEAVVFVPSEKVGDRFYAGGNVRVRVEGGAIVPIDAVGKCRGAVIKAVDLGVTIPVSTLGKERLELPTRPGELESKTAFVLFRLLNRGYALACERAGLASCIRVMQEKATISATKFVVHGVPGVAFLTFRDGWKVGEKSYQNVAFLAERDGKGNIRVIEALDDCKEVLTSSYEWKPAGDRFSGLGYPLGSMLRTLFAVMVQSRSRQGESTPSNADEISNNNAPLDGATAASES